MLTVKLYYAGAALRGASHIYAIGSRPNCIQIAKEYGATEIINYRSGDIVEQLFKATNGKGIDRVIISGGDCDTFAQAIKVLKPGGKIGNVKYLGVGEFIKIPRILKAFINNSFHLNLRKPHAVVSSFFILQ